MYFKCYLFYNCMKYIFKTFLFGCTVYLIRGVVRYLTFERKNNLVKLYYTLYTIQLKSEQIGSPLK